MRNFAEMPQLQAVDNDPAALAAPEPCMTGDEEGETHLRTDGAATLPQPVGAQVFVLAV